MVNLVQGKQRKKNTLSSHLLGAGASNPVKTLTRRVRRSPFLNRGYRPLYQSLVTDPTYNQYSVSYMRMQQSINRTALALGIAILGELFFQPLLYVAIVIVLIRFMQIPRRAFAKLRQGVLDVDLISSLTVFTGIISGYVVVTSFVALVFFYALRATLRVKGDVQSQMINVFKQQPLFVWVLQDGEEFELPFRALQAGDVVVVNAGGVIPVDGTVADGYAAVDQQALTGESQPVERGIGEPVLASTVVLSGKLYITVERAGADTKVAQIGQILNESVKKKSEVMLKAEDISDRSVPPTLLASAAVFPFVGLTGSFALLTSHFRKRPALFASVLLLNYFSILSDKRILVKDGRALDVLADVDTLVFDKTGTLTTTQPHVYAIHTHNGYTQDEVLRLAAAAEERQNHPIALAILQAAEMRGLAVPVVENVAYELGFGLNVSIEGHRLKVGSHRFIEREGIHTPPHIAEAEALAYNDGNTMIMVALDDRLIGAIELMPTLRPEARAVIDRLHELGIKETIIISGDHEQPTRKLADVLGIDGYYAETLPQQKASIIEELIAQGRTVCYVGDGINDAIALQTAQVSVSLSGASTVATDAAQVILLDESLGQLPTFFEFGLEYARISKRLVWGIVGLGTVGMSMAVLPSAVTLSVIVTLISLGGGLTYSVSPMLRYRWQKVQSRMLADAVSQHVQALQEQQADAQLERPRQRLSKPANGQ